MSFEFCWRYSGVCFNFLISSCNASKSLGLLLRGIANRRTKKLFLDWRLKPIMTMFHNLYYLLYYLNLFTKITVSKYVRKHWIKIRVQSQYSSHSNDKIHHRVIKQYNTNCLYPASKFYNLAKMVSNPGLAKDFDLCNFNLNVFNFSKNHFKRWSLLELTRISYLLIVHLLCSSLLKLSQTLIWYTTINLKYK